MFIYLFIRMYHAVLRCGKYEEIMLNIISSTLIAFCTIYSDTLTERLFFSLQYNVYTFFTSIYFGTKARIQI